MLKINCNKLNKNKMLFIIGILIIFLFNYFILDMSIGVSTRILLELIIFYGIINFLNCKSKKSKGKE